MFKFNKLRGRIVEKFGTIGKFAEALNVPQSTVSAKFKASKGFNQADMIKWSEVLEIAPEDYAVYFFN